MLCIVVSNIYFVTQSKFLKGWKYFVSKGEMFWSSIVNEPSIFAICIDKQNNHKKFNLVHYSHMWKAFEFFLPILFFLVALICKMISNATIVASSFFLQLLIFELFQSTPLLNFLETPLRSSVFCLVPWLNIFCLNYNLFWTNCPHTLLGNAS